jgi:hypothetical protein
MEMQRQERTMEQEEQLSWSELAELTHETQVDKFGFCVCEDTEPHEHPYDDCPKTGEY